MANSTILLMPTEIRLKILEYVFGSAETVRYGFEAVNDSSLITSINNLPVTCHKLYEEVQYCMEHTAFHFRNAFRFLDFFFKTRRDVHLRIRNISVKGFPFLMDGTDCAWSIGDLLPLLAGLKLDRLTVMDAFHDPGIKDGFGDQSTRILIDKLVAQDGWRELHVISPTSEFLNYRIPATFPNTAASLAEYLSDRKQPDCWNEFLLKKDGDQSGSLVRLYREKKPDMGTQSLDHCGAVFQLDGGTIEVDTRSNAETVGARNEAEQIYTSSDSVVIAHQSRTAWISYDQPNATEEGEHEYRIVAIRGPSVAYTQTGVNLHKDLRVLLKEKNRQVVANEATEAYMQDDPCAMF